MRKKDLLNEIASVAHSAGYTGKLHFATIDMADGLPSAINLIGIAVGVLALFSPWFGAKELSAAIIVLSVASMHYTHYQERRPNYERVGSLLLTKFTELRSLANDVDSLPDGSNFSAEKAKLEALSGECHGQSIPKQAFLASWYAHYKFYWQAESKWLDRYRDKPLSFWRDKMPLSLTAMIVLLIIVLSAYMVGLAPSRMHA